MMRTCSDQHLMSLAEQRQELWRRLKLSSSALKDASLSRTGPNDDTACYVGVNEWLNESNLFFRVERRSDRSRAVAVTVILDQRAERLVFRVHTVTIVDGAVIGSPPALMPLTYAAERDRFVIDAAARIDEPHMAEFFLDQAERALDRLDQRS